MGRTMRERGLVLPEMLGDPDDDAPDADQIEEMLTADSVSAADEEDQYPRLDVAPEVAALHLDDTRDRDEADAIEQQRDWGADDEDDYR